MNVSFIIPCLNAEKTIAQTIESVLQLEGLSDFEIIVVDNGSVDQTVSVVKKYPEVQVMHCQKKGAGSARNAGIKASAGTFLAFVDSDVILDPSWLRLLLPSLEKDGFSIALGSVKPGGEDNFFNRFRKKLNLIRYRGTGVSVVHPINAVAPTVNTAACLYRASLVKQIGGFDERLSRLEDTDLSVRVFHHAGAIFADQKARAQVFNTGSLWSYLKRSFVLGRARHELYQTSTYGVKTALKNYTVEIFSMPGGKLSFLELMFYNLNILMNLAGFLLSVILRKSLRPLPLSNPILIKMVMVFNFQLRDKKYRLNASSRVIVLDKTWYFFSSRESRWFVYNEPSIQDGIGFSDPEELEYHGLIEKVGENYGS